MIQAKKRLGQNFLIDKNIVNKIISEINPTQDDVILEIGPGHGELTRFLAKKAKRVIACEIDKRLFFELEKEFSNCDNVKVINLDFLKLDLEELYKKENSKFKVVGNLPYCISSPIIAYLLENKSYLSSIYLTLQKEFSRRIISKDDSKEKGAFTFFVQYHSRASLFFDISRTCFRPIPKVDSSFVKLEIKEPILNKSDEDTLFKIIRRAFQGRRKTLRNSLRGIFAKEVLSGDSFFNFGLRPQDLSLEDFIKLLDISKKQNFLLAF